jgi:hypothetical protein
MSELEEDQPFVKQSLVCFDKLSYNLNYKVFQDIQDLRACMKLIPFSTNLVIEFCPRKNTA